MTPAPYPKGVTKKEKVMSGHRILSDLAKAPFSVADPGDAKAIPLIHDLMYVPLVSTTTETRTVPVPTKAGLMMTLGMQTDGGDITVTVTSTYDGTNSTIVFNTAGDWVTLISIETAAGTFRWRILASSGVAAASPTGRIDFSGITPGAETTGSLVTTQTTWVPFTTAGACGIKLLLENQADTGEFASLRIRGRANNTTASGDGGNSVGTTTAGDFSASAIDHEYGNLKAINACAQPNALNQTTDATNIVTAVYGRIDATGTSIGRRWVEWIDTHATTKADASDFLARYSHNGTVAIDGLFTVYGGGRLPLFLNIEDATPGFVGTSTGVTTISKHLHVKINGTDYYIPLCSGTT